MKTHLSLATLLVVAALSSPLARAQEPDVFLESDGYVVMEAEHVDLVEDWIVVGSTPPGDPTMGGFLGDGYLEWTGKQYSGNTKGENQVAAILDYDFEISTPGVYLFRWRTKQYTGIASDQGNDTFVRFASGSPVCGEQACANGEEPDYRDFSQFTKVWVHSRQNWSWKTSFEPKGGTHVRNDKVRRYYEPGLHKIQLAARSPGHAIDRIVLFRSSHSFDASTFESLDESEIGSPTGGFIFGDDFEDGSPAGGWVSVEG